MQNPLILISSLFSPLVQVLFNSGYVKDSVMPGIPQKIYKAATKSGKTLQNDLEKQLKQATNYNYSGIDMKIAAKSIKNVFKTKNKIEEINFIIPSKEALKRVKIYNDNTREQICKSLDIIMMSFYNYYKKKQGGDNCSRQSITVNFILLNYVPSYHMHHTNEKCWFALVDKNERGIPYPTTYLYSKNIQNNNIQNDCSMYTTLDAMIKTQIKRFTPLREDPVDPEEKEQNDILKENFIPIILSDGNFKDDLDKFKIIKKKFELSQENKL